MSESQNLALPYLEASQAQKHVTHNEALRALDALVQLAVKDRDLATPPGSPAEGDRYIVAASPTGAWSGHAADIAVFQDGAWDFHDPKEGWRSWVDDENVFLIFNGTAWVDWGAALGVLQNLSLLGLGTTADATNPFSAKLNKALWTAKYAADGGDGDLRTTLNKEATSDTVSLLFQKAFSGRAEVGLIGDDDLLFKVSADGSTWLDALRIAKATGVVTFPVSSAGGVRDKLTANRTYYVRSDGSDSNTGLANSSGGAFLTIQKAINTVAQLDISIYDVTIQMGGSSGTFAGALVNGAWLGSGTVNLYGDATTPSNFLISTTSQDCIKVTNYGRLTVKGFKLTSTGGLGINATNGGIVSITGNMEYGAAVVHLDASLNGQIMVAASYSVTGQALAHYYGDTFGYLVTSGTLTVTLSGSLNFAAAFAYADGGRVVVPSSSVTFTGGTITGPRYGAHRNGIVNSAGGGASYFPGSTAGSTSTQGQYL